MTKEEEAREKAIQSIADVLRRTPFTVEIVVRKKPKGLRVIHEVTREHLDRMITNAKKKHDEDNKPSD